MLDFLEGRATGRLLRYYPRTDRVDLEALAVWPWLRKVVQRLPAQLREQKLGRMAWVLAFTTDGQVVHDLQDPSGSYGPVTSVTETNGRLLSVRWPSDGCRRRRPC
jgi:hypothetical protein